MSLYTKALKYIDMNRVKELREDKIERKKIADEIREQIREELKNLNSPYFSNWRCDLDESMTTSSFMSTTLAATGDADLVNVDVSSGDTWIGSGNNAGTVSATGLSFDQRPSQGDSHVNWLFANATSSFDATQVNNLKVTVTTGTGVDAPKSGNPLKVEWFNGADFGLLGTFSAGGGTQVFELPKEANVKDLKIFYSVSSDGTHPYSTYSNEYLVGKNVFGGTMNSTDSSGAMSILRLGASASEANKIIFGRAWWIDALSNGNPRGYQVPSDPGGTGFGDPDSIALYNQIISLYASFATRGSDLYTITTTNFQRRTPMNVFVGLDSPEASAFIRTDPTMQGLSAEDRKKKLEDMLDAGDEYLLKYLGITGSSARPSDTTMPDSWEQSAGQTPYGGTSDYGLRPDGTRGIPQPGEFNKGNDGKWYEYSPGGWQRIPSASTGNQDTEVAVKGVGGSPGQEYIDPNKGKKFVPPPKDFQRPGSPPVKKATSGSGDTEVAVKGVGGSPGQEYIDPNKGKKFVPMPKDFKRPGSSPVKKATSGDDYGNIAAIRDKPGDSPNNIKWNRKPGEKNPPGSGYVPSNQPMGPQVPLANRRRQSVGSGVKDYGDVAAGYGAGGPNPYGTRGADNPYIRKGYKDKKGKFVNFDDPATWPSMVQKAGYEPKGEVLSEKKRLKSVKDATSKIPGYYDGKPAPLGFPMQEPPEMINGLHPDLVTSKGQKKQSNRYNRLDPASAKAMPPTGNPHIDKKVRAAAKKPK